MRSGSAKIAAHVVEGKSMRNEEVPIYVWRNFSFILVGDKECEVLLGSQLVVEENFVILSRKI